MIESILFRKRMESFPLNGDSLYVLNVNFIPWGAKIFSSLERTVLADKFDMISTSAYLL